MDELLHLPWQAKAGLAVLGLALLVSVVTDLRRRLIYNAVTLPALAACLVLPFSLGGLGALGNAALGVLACAGPLFLAMMAGWVAAGDVKLIAVCGAVAGWPFALLVLLYVSIAGGVQAVLWLLAARVRGAERPKHVPYGLAIAAGTAWAFMFGGSLF